MPASKSSANSHISNKAILGAMVTHVGRPRLPSGSKAPPLCLNPPEICHPDRSGGTCSRFSSLVSSTSGLSSRPEGGIPALSTQGPSKHFSYCSRNQISGRCRREQPLLSGAALQRCDKGYSKERL